MAFWLSSGVSGSFELNLEERSGFDRKDLRCHLKGNLPVLRHLDLISGIGFGYSKIVTYERFSYKK